MSNYGDWQDDDYFDKNKKNISPGGDSGEALLRKIFLGFILFIIIGSALFK